jgi:hypothetical protein
MGDGRGIKKVKGVNQKNFQPSGSFKSGLQTKKYGVRSADCGTTYLVITL